MKKAVITILLILPFVLIVMISLAAQIVSNYQYIQVESVCFAGGEDLKCVENDTRLKIGLNKKLKLEYIIYPELATNKEVTITSSDESIVSIDKDGFVIGKNYGSTSITIKTNNGNKTDKIIIDVKDDYVSSVTLDKEEIELNKKGTYNLIATINPYTALNKNVTWESNNPNVATVDGNGLVKAIGPGEAIITVTTLDGNYIDSCKVTVLEEVVFGFADYEEGLGTYIINENSIDLNDLLIHYKSDIIGVNKSNVVYKIKSGGASAVLEGNILKNIQKNVAIRVQAVVVGPNDTYTTDIWIKYKN